MVKIKVAELDTDESSHNIFARDVAFAETGGRCRLLKRVADACMRERGVGRRYSDKQYLSARSTMLHPQLRRNGTQ